MRRLRLVLMVITLIVLQTTVFTHLRVFDAAPDLLLIATIAIAYEEGPRTGALFGFAAGLAIDCFLSTPVGLSALAFSLTGYFIGVFQGGLVRETRSLGPVLSGLGALIGGALFVVAGGVAGESGFLTLTSVRIVLLASLYGAVVSFGVFPFARWANRDLDQRRPLR